MVTHICKLSAGERETLPNQPRLISKPQFPIRDLSKYTHTHTHWAVPEEHPTFGCYTHNPPSRRHVHLHIHMTHSRIYICKIKANIKNNFLHKK